LYLRYERIPDCTPSIPDSGEGALKILKTWKGGASKIYQYPQQGPYKNMSFFQEIFIPPPPPPPLGIINVLSLSELKFEKLLGVSYTALRLKSWKMLES
jgi:hypothetical protein